MGSRRPQRLAACSSQVARRSTTEPQIIPKHSMHGISMYGVSHDLYIAVGNVWRKVFTYIMSLVFGLSVLVRSPQNFGHMISCGSGL